MVSLLSKLSKFSKFVYKSVNSLRDTSSKGSKSILTERVEEYCADKMEIRFRSQKPVHTEERNLTVQNQNDYIKVASFLRKKTAALQILI